ncbi:MAG: flagellar basal-body MS-ring/collar protein FliF [Ancalomicrobiaceae bacterium]|nr:flagellar basal-body MS-ring/collar protein FliF [Ancalomicrobiaceae bacterium]
MNGAIEFIKTLGVPRLAAMGVVAVLLLGFFGFIIMRATAPAMVPIYSDLSVQDSGAIVKELEAQAITYELRQDGAQIMVPKDQMARMRMRLAEKGLPLGGSVGYEIFDKTDALGTTSFVQNINHLRALEGELSRTIRSLDRVQQARVHLVIPERQLFQREKVEPSASIVLKLQGTIEPAQVKAIQHLVATAIQGMRPGRVSVVDESGRMLASGMEDDQPGMILSSLQDRNTAFERRVETQVETILAQVVGQGRSQVRVTAELDYNRVTQTSDKFDPEGQVVRSEQTEEGNTSNQNQEKGVTVANQVPGAQQLPDGTTQKEASTTTKETRNFEISKTSRTEIIEAGRIKRLSVAVLVDGTYTTAADGAVTYQPRQQADVDRIAALVKSAVGFDQSRGDVVEVVNLRFAEAPASLPLENAKSGFAALFDFTKDDILRFTEMGVLLLMTLLVLLFAVRPLIRRITTEAAKAEETASVGQLGLPNLTAVQNAQAVAALTAGPDGTAAGTSDGAGGEHGPSGPSKLEMAKQLGALQATSIAKVGEMIKADPGEAAAIVRTWLTDAA